LNVGMPDERDRRRLQPGRLVRRRHGRAFRYGRAVAGRRQNGDGEGHPARAGNGSHCQSRRGRHRAAQQCGVFVGVRSRSRKQQALIHLSVDPAKHSKYRTILDPLFAPKRMDAIDDDVAARANHFIDTFVEAAPAALRRTYEMSRRSCSIEHAYTGRVVTTRRTPLRRRRRNPGLRSSQLRG